jgi:cAMP-specific phosphodiesterase 4
MMKCADVCNSSKDLSIHKKWVNLVLEEFFQQGDREKSLNLSVSPLMDRDTVDIASSQTGFIDFICAPLYNAFHKYADISQVIDGIERNRAYWSKDHKDKETPSAETE